MGKITARILEAYVGEYASGKSEVALNRALYLLEEGRRPVTLVDFDLVEPFYTLRPIKKELEEKGLTVIAWDTSKTLGLGEAGTLIKPEMRWVLKKPGDIIFDVGYGVAGAGKLKLVEDQGQVNLIRIYAVVNIARPITGDVEGIVEYVRTLGPVDGIINNSHLGDDTDINIIQEGARIVTSAANILGLPLIWTTVDVRFARQLNSHDIMGNKIMFLKRHMDRAFW